MGSRCTKMNLPFQDSDEVAEVAQRCWRHSRRCLPQPRGFIAEHAKPGYDYGDEFAFGLDLILDGLERLPGAS